MIEGFDLIALVKAVDVTESIVAALVRMQVILGLGLVLRQLNNACKSVLTLPCKYKSPFSLVLFSINVFHDLLFLAYDWRASSIFLLNSAWVSFGVETDVDDLLEEKASRWVLFFVFINGSEFDFSLRSLFSSMLDSTRLSLISDVLGLEGGVLKIGLLINKVPNQSY